MSQQGLRQHIPAAVDVGEGAPVSAEPKLALVDSGVDQGQRVDRGVVSVPVLGGLHHHYHRLVA